LHHPDFQSLEGIWRSVEFLVRRLETSSTLRIVLYDISAEEFASDLSSAENLADTGLYSLLVEQPALDAQQGSVSAIITNYAFEKTPAQADLLARMSRIAAAGQFAFLAAVGTGVLKKLKPEEIDPQVQASWSALQSLQEAAYVGLTVPRFMLRAPYGEKSESIDRFDFEEFSPQEGTRAILYTSGAFLAGLLLGESFVKGGMKKLNLGSIMSAGDMPYFVFEDPDGEQVALPCTERLLSVDLAAHVTTQRLMPVLGIKGRPEVRLGSFQSITGSQLAGPWAPVVIKPSEAAAAPSAVSQPEPPAAAVQSDSEPAPAAAAPPPAPAEALAPAAAEPAALDAELDSLLASLNTGGDASTSPTGGDQDLDPGLAALLADL